MAQGTPDQVSIVVRLPKTLHAQLKRRAAAQDRSMAEHLRHLIKQDVKRT